MRKTTDRRRKKIAPVVVTVLVILYIIPMLAMAFMLLGQAEREGAGLPLPLLCYIVLGGAVIVGILKAMFQRLEEIDDGEEEDASQY